MTLAENASANHAVIHRQIGRAAIGAGGIDNPPQLRLEEIVDGRGDRPPRARRPSRDALGVIPGSMSAPGFVVRGLGNPESLDSAAHGAGRRMSRKQAFQTFDWETVERDLRDRGVELLSAGLDEAPDAYKDIRQVMADQADLVVALAEFHPRLVKMDPGGRPRYGGGGKKGTKRRRR